MVIPSSDGAYIDDHTAIVSETASLQYSTSNHVTDLKPARVVLYWSCVPGKDIIIDWKDIY